MLSHHVLELFARVALLSMALVCSTSYRNTCATWQMWSSQNSRKNSTSSWRLSQMSHNLRDTQKFAELNPTAYFIWYKLSVKDEQLVLYVNTVYPSTTLVIYAWSFWISISIPYSYKFSRGQIFAHFVCAKINYFRADLFSRTFKTINFCADKISRTSFFSTSKTLKFTPKSAVLWRKLFHIVLKIFARINFRAPVQNLRKFGTYFRAISRKIGLCAKMRENLYARKLVRIRQLKTKSGIWRQFSHKSKTAHFMSCRGKFHITLESTF